MQQLVDRYVALSFHVPEHVLGQQVLEHIDLWWQLNQLPVLVVPH
jgi:hypothetical protein